MTLFFPRVSLVGDPAIRVPDLPAAPGADPLFGRYAWRFKRLLDLFIVALAAPVAVPLVLLLALAVAADGGQPFYGQERLGRGGRRFRMWKLRSMVLNADRTLEEVLARDPALRAEWDSHQKLRRDPRITRLGRFLRRSSLDELPQLWNVVRGEMSIVGPRPMLPEQTSLYTGHAYYMLRPGLTGLWQVSERNESDFSQRAARDTEYAQMLSFAADLRLILATFRVVLRGTGC